jgi:hypothetical protein
MSKSVLMALTTIGLLSVIAAILSWPPGSTTFDSGSWKEASNENSHNRIGMLQDLTSKHKLIGLTKTEVMDLLGAPSGGEIKDGVNTYDMGKTTGHDDNFFYIYLKDGIVVKYEDVQR